MTLPAVGTVTFKYDPFGRRIYKSSSLATSVYAYDGDNLIEEVNASGAVVARYAQTQNVDEPVAELRSGATSYYEADGLGSVTSLTSTAGALTQVYSYDSFGKQTASGSLTNPFQYTAREFDTETGLYYYRARYYDQSAGRFLSEDSLKFMAGENFYRYVDNNPVFWADASGLMPSSPVAALVPSTVLPGRLKLEGNLDPLRRKGRNFAADAAMIETSLATRQAEINFYANHPDPHMRALAGDPGHLQRIENEEETLRRCKDNNPDCEGEKEHAPDFLALPEWDAKRVLGVGVVGAVGAGAVYVIVNYWWIPVLAF